MANLINRKQVEFMTGMSRSTIYYLMSERRFPKQIKCGRRMVRWNQADVERWVKAPLGWSLDNQDTVR